MRDWKNTILYGRVGAPEDLQDKAAAAVPILTTGRGQLYVEIANSDVGSVYLEYLERAIADNAGPGLAVLGFNYLHDGANTWNREQANVALTLLASASRTATTSSTAQTNISAKGGHFVFEITAVTGSPNLTLSVEGISPVSGLAYNILTGTPLITTSTQILKVFPGLSAIPGGIANDILPRDYRITVTPSTTDAVTYSVGVLLVK